MIDLSNVTKEEYLRDLTALIDNTDQLIKNACNYLNWDLEKIKEKHEKYIVCPFDEGHWMPKESLEKHLQSCEWKALGYTKECVPLSESSLPPDNPSSLKFDAEIQQKIFIEAKQKDPESNISTTERFTPQTSDRLFSDFTTDERRAMYDYVVANTIAPDIGEDIADINKTSEKSEDKQSKTMVELLAQERNLKRRRAKYKGVHTNKKTHTEILREIIEQQLEMFKEHLAEKHGYSLSDEFGEQKDKSTAISERKSYKAHEQHKHDSKQSRSYDQNPSLHQGQIDQYADHANSYRNQQYGDSEGHRSRNRNRYYTNDEEYKNFRSSKYYSKTDESHSKDRNSSRSSRDESLEKNRHEKYSKEHGSHRREEKHNKHKHSKHKHRSRSRSRSKNKKKDKSRDRSRSKNRDRKKHRSTSRNRRRHSRSKSREIKK